MIVINPLDPENVRSSSLTGGVSSAGIAVVLESGVAEAGDANLHV